MTLAQIVMSGTLDQVPNLKISAHHGGGLIPHFAGRIRELVREERSPSSPPLVEFFGPDHVLFGTDVPFDGAGGVRFISMAIADVNETVEGSSERAAIISGNIGMLLAPSDAGPVAR